MKKTYVTPEVEVNETMAANMMALSIMNEYADDSDALSKPDGSWDIWGREE